MYVPFLALGSRVMICHSAAEAFAKDPRNPYAAKIAKEAHH